MRALPRIPGRRKLTRRRNVAVVSLGLGDGFSSDVGLATALRGIEQSLANSHHAMVLATMPAAPSLHSLFDRELDGMIIRGTGFDSVAPERVPSLLLPYRKLPRIWILERVNNATGDLCCCDAEAVGRLAAEYFCSMGHRRVGYLNPRAGSVQVNAMRDAFTRYAVGSGCTIRHFETAPPPVACPGPAAASPVEVDALVEQWAAGAKTARASALLVPSAAAVVNLYFALGRRGLHVPHDVSVLCCSESDLALADLEPAVAAIDMNLELVGARAADHLLSCLGDGADRPAVRILIEPTLVPRPSVGPVRQ